MKTGGNRPHRVHARRKRAGIDRIYAIARQISHSRAFTTGAGRYSFTERGEEKRRRRRQPCFLAAEAEACLPLLARVHRPRAPSASPPLHLRLAARVHQGSVHIAPAAPARPHLLARLRRPSTHPPRMLPASSLVSSAALLPSSSSAFLLFLCFFPSSSVSFLCFFPCSTSH
jgi:hypothetical protein